MSVEGLPEEKKRNDYSFVRSQSNKKSTMYEEDRKIQMNVVIKMYQLFKVRNLYKLYIKNHRHSV